MKSALVRQPRVGPAAPRVGRVLRLALGFAGAVLAAGVVVLQPFAASHLLPGRTAVSSAAPMPSPGDAAAAAGNLPIAAESAGGPAEASAQPGTAAAAPAAEPAPQIAAPPAALRRNPRATTAAARSTPPEPPAAALGAPPPPRKPLPLETDLIVAPPPGAAATAPPAPAPADDPRPAGKPAASDRRG